MTGFVTHWPTWPRLRPRGKMSWGQTPVLQQFQRLIMKTSNFWALKGHSNLVVSIYHYSSMDLANFPQTPKEETSTQLEPFDCHASADLPPQSVYLECTSIRGLAYYKCLKTLNPHKDLTSNDWKILTKYPPFADVCPYRNRNDVLTASHDLELNP